MERDGKRKRKNLENVITSYKSSKDTYVIQFIFRTINIRMDIMEIMAAPNEGNEQGTSRFFELPSLPFKKNKHERRNPIMVFLAILCMGWDYKCITI